HEVCRNAGIPLFIDGARLGYGLASDAADITLKEFAQLCDVFYIGGTKVGALFGECVVAHKGILNHFFPLVKQHGALLAKGRLLGIQFGTLFTDGLYLQIARHAVEMAMILKEGFIAKGIKPFIDSPTNQQFFTLPNEVMDRLAEHATFEVWGTRGEMETNVRFVTSWATKEENVRKLVELI
ncbi:MAG: low specificity L-threonine aldolase, partial [Bacteroidales bacterium]|nr:low specificity L-threonine aldolase [Candidatus Cryptobacteroides faecihippi]